MGKVKRLSAVIMLMLACIVAIVGMTACSEAVNVESVTLNYTQLTMLKGESKTLTATVLPSTAIDKSVTWQSSNTSVVTVDNGMLNAVGYGNANITVTTIDGEKTATCAVEVIEDKITFKTLTVNEEDVSETIPKTIAVNGKVSNAMEIFSFIEEIEVSGNAKYKVYEDVNCSSEIASKIINLNEGDNTVYVMQTVGEELKEYKVTIRRAPMYTVTFEGNGGTVKSGNATQTLKHGGSIVAPTFEKSGYTFNGWDKDIPTKMPAKNITVTSQWKINQYTLTIVYGNGQKNKTITQNYDTSIEPEADPTRDGYTFDGWDKTFPTKMPAEDITVTAKWLAIFTIDGETVTGLTKHGNSLTEIVIPSKIDGVSMTSIGDYAFA